VPLEALFAKIEDIGLDPCVGLLESLHEPGWSRPVVRQQNMAGNSGIAIDLVWSACQQNDLGIMGCLGRKEVSGSVSSGGAYRDEGAVKRYELSASSAQLVKFRIAIGVPGSPSF
jgi:hypothetical protein